MSSCAEGLLQGRSPAGKRILHVWLGVKGRTVAGKALSGWLLEEGAAFSVNGWCAVPICTYAGQSRLLILECQKLPHRYLSRKL